MQTNQVEKSQLQQKLTLCGLFFSIAVEGEAGVPRVPDPDHRRLDPRHDSCHAAWSPG